jgi:hypothetical protein
MSSRKNLRSVEGLGSLLMTAARAAVVGGAASRALGEGMNALPEARAIAKMIIRMADVDVDGWQGENDEPVTRYTRSWGLLCDPAARLEKEHGHGVTQGTADSTPPPETVIPTAK